MYYVDALDSRAIELIEVAGELASGPIAAAAADVDREARFPADAMRSLSEAGLLGLCVPASFGGLEQGPGAFAGVVERLAMHCPSTAMIYVMHVAASQTVIASSSLPRREEVLREIAAGEHLTTLAFSERGSRSQFWAPVSRFQAGGDGLRVRASKSWVTSAHHARSYVCSVLEPDAESPMALTLYLLDPGSQGVKFGPAFDGLGLRGNDSVPVELEDVSVSVDDLLTPRGEGADVTLQVILPWFCVGTSAMSHGLCLAAVEATRAHLSTAEFQHDGTQLRDLPNLRARLAEMSTRTGQSRALSAATIKSMSEPDETTPLLVLQSRLAALQAAVDVTDLAMKTCGGAAFSRHLGIERMFRDARAGWVMAPTVDHLKDFIGRALTGLPLF